MEQEEGERLTNVLNAAHRLRTRSEAGVYKGSMQDSKNVPAARQLAEDLKALIDAAKAARPSED